MTDQAMSALEAVERFHASEFSADMIPAPRGDYVRHSDYAALSAALERKKEAAEFWEHCAAITEKRAEALDAKLKEALDVMQAWKTAGTDQDYYQAVQKRNAFLASLEGDKP